MGLICPWKPKTPCNIVAASKGAGIHVNALRLMADNTVFGAPWSLVLRKLWKKESKNHLTNELSKSSGGKVTIWFPASKPNNSKSFPGEDAIAFLTNSTIFFPIFHSQANISLIVFKADSFRFSIFTFSGSISLHPHVAPLIVPNNQWVSWTLPQSCVEALKKHLNRTLFYVFHNLLKNYEVFWWLTVHLNENNYHPNSYTC